MIPGQDHDQPDSQQQRIGADLLKPNGNALAIRRRMRNHVALIGHGRGAGVLEQADAVELRPQVGPQLFAQRDDQLSQPFLLLGPVDDARANVLERVADGDLVQLLVDVVAQESLEFVQRRIPRRHHVE